MTVSPTRKLKRPQKRSRRGQQPNYILIGSAVVVAGVFAASYFSPESRAYREMQYKASQSRLTADFERAQQKQATELAEFVAEQNEIATAAEAEIAHDRYRAGCSVVFIEPSDGQYVTQAAGLSTLDLIVDINTGKPYPPGQVVCDDRFMTAVIGPDGRINSDTFARATDPKIVNQRFHDAAKWHPGAARSFGETDINVGGTASE